MADSADPQASLLLCAHRGVTAETMTSILQVLLDMADPWRLFIRSGDALLAHARSALVGQWLRETEDDVFLMVDDDIVFGVEDARRVVRLCRDGRDIVCGAYPTRGAAGLAIRGLDDESLIEFGPDLPPVEIRCGGTGFMAVHRRVVMALREELPVCDNGDGAPYHPYFAPASFTSVPGGTGVFLSEDYAFCELARRQGFRVWLDPETILTHLCTIGLSVHNMAGVRAALSAAQG